MYIYIYICTQLSSLYFNTIIENGVYASFDLRIIFDFSLFIRDIFDSNQLKNVITLFCLNFPDFSSVYHQSVSLTFDSIWFEKLPINRSCKFTSWRNTSSESKPICDRTFYFPIEYSSFLPFFHKISKLRYNDSRDSRREIQLLEAMKSVHGFRDIHNNNANEEW